MPLTATITGTIVSVETKHGKDVLTLYANGGNRYIEVDRKRLEIVKTLATGTKIEVLTEFKTGIVYKPYNTKLIAKFIQTKN